MLKKCNPFLWYINHYCFNADHMPTFSLDASALSSLLIQSGRARLKENETLESAVYRQISSKRINVASEQLVSYQPEFPDSFCSTKSTSLKDKTTNERGCRKNSGKTSLYNCD